MKIMDEIRELDLEESELNALLNHLSLSIDALKRATSIEEKIKYIGKINILRDHYLTLYWCSYLGYLKNITDEKYLKSEDLFGTIDAKYNNLVCEYFRFLSENKNEEELKSWITPRTFALASNQIRLLSDENVELIKREKELCRAYRKLLMGTRFEFNGEKTTINKLSKYFKNDDRLMRKNAMDKKYEILMSLRDDLETIADELIQVREKIAKNLGMKNYKDYGFVKMNRIGYDEGDLQTFKDNVKKYFVPLLVKLEESQCERLHLEKLEYYDEQYLFPDGNAEIKESLEELVEILKRIFKEMNMEIYDLFVLMEKEGLIDLEERENKSSGGLTTYLPDYHLPTFIKTYMGLEENFTSILHEFGHSIQLYMSRNKKYHENRWPTFDICETHSTSMELLVYPYLESIFKEDVDKYCLRHLTSLIELVIKMCAIDEFNSQIYENPSLSKEERNALWKSIYQEYYPYRQYTHEYYSLGLMWQSDQNRIDDPFYGIDYSLDTICAFSFYQKSLEDKENAFLEYLNLCKDGGDLSFKEMVEKYHLSSPFKEDDIKSLSIFLEGEIKKYVKEI